MKNPIYIHVVLCNKKYLNRKNQLKNVCRALNNHKIYKKI